MRCTPLGMLLDYIPRDRNRFPRFLRWMLPQGWTAVPSSIEGLFMLQRDPTASNVYEVRRPEASQCAVPILLFGR
jgi:hypothetical protein